MKNKRTKPDISLVCCYKYGGYQYGVIKNKIFLLPARVT